MKYSTLQELRILNQITETNVSQVTQTLNQNFEKGLISEELCENSFKELDNLIEKAGNHKYFKREGSPGKYKYYYTEAEYREARGSGKSDKSKSKFENKEEKSTSKFDWSSKDAKILAKKGITRDNLEVRGDLYLRETQITSLPDNLKVGGDLYLGGTQITSLPDNLKVRGGLDLSRTQITSLPDNLKVRGGLYLGGTQITSLPENLKVGGNLYLSRTQITSLPENLKVRGDLDLRGTQIKRSDFKDSMEIKGEIYF